MNCDEAFEVLTQRDSMRRQELLWHLDMCPRCRELQKVLEPALLMFENQGASSSESYRESSTNMPTRQALNSQSPRPARLSNEALDLAEQTAAKWKKSRTTRIWRRFGVIAATVCCLVIAVHASMARRTEPGTELESPSAAAMPLNSCLWVAQDQETPISPNLTNHDIILSCVNCHLKTDGSL